MQLDKTLIVVRERGVFDTLDLALRVWRIYACPLCVTMFLGAGLWAVVNYLLTGWMLNPTSMHRTQRSRSGATFVIRGPWSCWL